MKRTVLLALLLLSVSSLVAEGQREEAASGSIKPVNITMSIWGREAHQQMYQGLLDRTKETHPHINSEVILIPWKEYQQKMSILVAADEAPDIAWLAETMLPQFLDAGNLRDISGIADDADYDFDDFIEATLKLVRSGEALYGLPFSTPPSIIYWNKDLFDKNGLESPVALAKRGEWNYEKFLEYAIALGDRENDVYGFDSNMLNGSFLHQWTPFVWGYGASWWNEDGDRFTLNSSEGEKALQLFSDLVLKYQVHPQPGDQTAFESGKIGLFQDTLRYLANARKIDNFQWSICPFPEGPSGGKTKMGYAAYTVMNDRYEDEDIFAALRAITDTEAYMQTASFFVPCRESVINSPEFLKNYQPIPEEDARVSIIEGLKTGQTLAGHKNFAKIDTLMDSAVESLLLTHADVKEILELMEKEIQPLMD